MCCPRSYDQHSAVGYVAMARDADRLGISLNIVDASPEELDELTAALRRELLQLDVDGVDRPSGGPAPDGARGVDLAAVGQLFVELGSAAPILGNVVEVIKAWASRSPNRTAKLTLDGDTLEINGMSEHEQHVVVRDW